MRPPSGASSLCLSVYRTTGNSLVAQMSETLVVKPAKVALIFAIAWLARRVLVRLIGRLINGHARRVETVAALFRSVTSVTVWTIATLMALAELGLNLGPLIAGAGVVGVAVGFGAQNLVRDFLSGIFMLIEDQYGVGDVIDAGPAVGTVEGVSLRSTRLRDVDGTVWHVPKTTPHDQPRVTRELRARIKCAFDEAGIEIPFTQRTVWHRTGDGATALVPAAALPATSGRPAP